MEQVLNYFSNSSLFFDFFNNFFEFTCRNTFWRFRNIAFSLFCRSQKFGFQGHLSHEWNFHVLAHLSSAASDRWEDLTFTFAMRTYKATHIFDYTQNFCLCFLAEIDFFADIAQGDLLRGCYDYGAVEVGLFQVLDDGYVLVTCAWWSIDN